MSPHQINHRAIDLIRRSEGWREYVKYLENEYIRAIEMTSAAKTDRDTIENAIRFRAIKEILAFVKAEPKEERK